MKPYALSILLVCLLIKLPAQTDSFEKPNGALFKELTAYKSNAFFIIQDQIHLKFRYLDKYVGAQDDSFKLGLSRKIRLKVNRMGAIQDAIVEIPTHLDNLSHLDFDKLKIYNSKGKVIEKKNPKGNPSLMNYQDGVITINLKNIKAQDNTIIDIGFSVSEIAKDTQILNFKFPFLTLASSVNLYIPEIYEYEMVKNDPNGWFTDYQTEEKRGVFICYYMPNEAPGLQMVSKRYYKILKDKGRDMSDAVKVYCKYYNHYYNLAGIRLADKTVLENTSLMLFKKP